MTFFNILPAEWCLHHSPPPRAIHPPSTPFPNTHSFPLLFMSQWPAEIVASCFHLTDPLSRCWIWSNHSQSSLNILFFKQNRGSKFHHSMTRSGADNTIKPIPAYPKGAISGGTAERWAYTPTERCQSPLIHSHTNHAEEEEEEEGLIGAFKDQHLPKKINFIFCQRSGRLSKSKLGWPAAHRLTHTHVCSFIHRDIQKNVNSKARSFSSHLKAFLLKMLLGHWANKGQGGYEIVCLTGLFPLCVPAAQQPYPHS